MKKMYILYILTKIYFNTILRILKNTFIANLCKTKLEKKYCAPVDLKRNNLIFQKKFVKIFMRYHECKNCVSHCCHSKINRFDFVDCYLNNFVLKEGLSPWHQIPHLLSAIIDLFHTMSKFYKDESPSENCLYYSISSGCLLPVGNRPMMCVAGACYKLLKEFSSDDLRKYSFLLSKYIVFHLKCFFYLLKKLLFAQQF